MKKTIILFSLFVVTAPLCAQVTVTRVTDRRTSGKFFAELSIAVELAKVKAGDVAAQRVLVASAVDDTGRSLVDPEKEPRLETNSMTMMDDDDKARPANVSITLLNPSRKAKTLKEVRGDIELFMPSKDPNSVALIPKFLAQAGKPINHKALKANGIEITLLTSAQIDAEKKKMGDARRKELADAGYEADALDEEVKSYLEYKLRLDDGELLFRVKDPNKRIQDISYIAGSEAKHVSMSEEEGGFMKFSTWGEKPEADWGLRISMTTPKNLVRQSFVLKNVALP